MRPRLIAVFVLSLSTFALGLASGYFVSDFRWRAMGLINPVSVETDTPGSGKTTSEPSTPTTPAESRIASPGPLQPAISPSYTPISTTNPEERYRQLQELPPEEFPTLVAELCTDLGPEGLNFQEKNLIHQGMRKWWSANRETLLQWISTLPPTETKRYLMTKLLKEFLSEEDPTRAKKLAEAYSLQDPKWASSDFKNIFLGGSIESGWKNPNATAEQMLALYQQANRGSHTEGSNVGIYPEGFDFRKFLDGMDALNATDHLQSSIMPSDTLAAWAKQDPQQAAQWLLQAQAKWQQQNRTSLPFADWDQIVNAVAGSKGPQVYYEWAAKFVGSLDEQSRRKILSAYGRDGDVLGILGATQNTETRDKVLTSAIGMGGDAEQAIGYLKLLSTPEARLNAIKSNKSRLNDLSKEFVIDKSAYKQLGFTEEQFKKALAEDN